MKALKAIGRFFTEPKFEIYWAAIWLAMLIHRLVTHATHTATGWNISLSGWDAIFVAMTHALFIFSAARWWYRGRA